MQNAEPIQLRQVRDFGQIISTTFSFLKQNWKPLFRAIATMCLPIAVVAGFFAGGSMANIQAMSMRPGGDPLEVFSVMGRTMFTLIPAYLLLLFSFLLLVAIVHEYLRAYSMGEHVGITSGDLWKRAWPQLGSYFGLTFLSGLLAIVGMLLCIVPFFYVWTVLSLVAISHAIERTGGAGSLARSNSLVNGDFWPTLGLVIVIGIINALINYVVQIPVAIVTLTATMNGTMHTIQTGEPGSMPSWFSLFMSIATAVQWCFMMLTYPIVAVCMGLKYFSRVEEKEGHGLQERIANFDQA